MDEVTWRTETRCTYDRLHVATGISVTALHKMGNDESKRLDVATLETLLDYFGEQLGREMTTQDLLRYG